MTCTFVVSQKTRRSQLARREANALEVDYFDYLTKKVAQKAF